MKAVVSLLFGLGLTVSHPVLAATTVTHLKVQKPNISELLTQDNRELRKDIPPRFAKTIPVSVTPDSHGTWTDTATGHQWVMRVSSPDALSINLGFSSYRMPEGGQLVIAATDGSHAVSRPFTAGDNEIHGELWTPMVNSSDLTLTVNVPKGTKGELKLVLDSFNYGYKDFSRSSIDSGSCNVDVVCTEGDPWRDIIRSVAVISTGGSRFCTGFLVNNVREDRTPFFMTAAHCSVSPSNAASLVTYWNYDNTTCREPGSSSSGRSGDGRLDQFNTGAIFRSKYNNSDFTLLELDDPVLAEANPYFAGWSASEDDAEAAVAIHHPATDEKRISFEFEPTTTTGYGARTTPGDGSHIMVADWNIGTTEPGSSGSPLFNNNGQVIGQLHGGYAACGNDDPDWYGRISTSWLGAGTPESQLKHWLDPDDTGAITLDGIDSQR